VVWWVWWVGVVGVGGWGWFPLAFEHSKVCTLCDFGHLQLYNENRVLKERKRALLIPNHDDLVSISASEVVIVDISTS
jgi:hypothetical protein